MAEEVSPAMFFVLLLVLYSKALIIKCLFPYFYENIQEIKPDKKASRHFFYPPFNLPEKIILAIIL